MAESSTTPSGEEKPIENKESSDVEKKVQSEGIEKKESDEKKKESNDEIPPISPEILEKMSPEVKRVISEQMTMMHFSGQMPSPIMKKFNEGHITQFLDLSDKSEERDHKRFRFTTRWVFIFSITFIGLFVFLVWFLYDKNPDLLRDILKVGGTLLIGLLGGFGGGYGYKTLQQRNE